MSPRVTSEPCGQGCVQTHLRGLILVAHTAPCTISQEIPGKPLQQNLAVWEEWGAKGWGPCLAAYQATASEPWSGWSHWKESPLTKRVCFWSDTNAQTCKSMECKTHYKTLVPKGTPLGMLFVAAINVLKSYEAPLIKSLLRVLFNFFIIIYYLPAS